MSNSLYPDLVLLIFKEELRHFFALLSYSVIQNSVDNMEFKGDYFFSILINANAHFHRISQGNVSLA